MAVSNYLNQPAEQTVPQIGQPLAKLPVEDLEFVSQLVLHSGSLKDVAKHYDVSYPTIRVRLDRLIARLSELMKGHKPDPLSELLGELVDRGELSLSTAKHIRDAARKAQQGGQP